MLSERDISKIEPKFDYWGNIKTKNSNARACTYLAGCGKGSR